MSDVLAEAARQVTDAELTVLALAADADQEPDADAVPLVDDTSGLYGPLPAWYMAPVRVTRRTALKTGIVIVLVVSFLLIEALGLCVTYGQPVAA
jgi:hypothetical protein